MLGDQRRAARRYRALGVADVAFDRPVLARLAGRCEQRTGGGNTHAWVRVYLPGSGWVEFDPTNGMRASDDHITVGYGRDYGDVAPIVGVVKIAGKQATEQSVDVVPLAE